MMPQDNITEKMWLDITFQHKRTVVVSKNLCPSLQRNVKIFPCAVRKAPWLQSRDTFLVHYHTKRTKLLHLHSRWNNKIEDMR